MQLGAAAAGVLSQLEQRSVRERPELDRLNSIGAGATRAAAPQLMLDVGPDVGRFLHSMVKVTGAQRILEIGGSVGYSTVWLATAAAVTGGRVVSVEPDATKAAQLRGNVDAAGLGHLVEVVVDDAGAVVPAMAGPFDVVLIDHWKDLYVREFDAVWPRVRVGGVVVADNIVEPAATAELMQAYVSHARAAAGAYSLTLPLGDGIEVTWRTDADAGGAGS